MTFQSVIILVGAVFLMYLLLLPASPEAMFSDPDTYWHIATGDAIRHLGAIPEHDPWSLSAGDKHWYITSWGWDVLASYVYQHFGWHGIIVMNSLIIAATLAVVFATCLIRCKDGFSAFLATLLASACLMDFSVRPHQAGLLCIAILMLLLAKASNRVLLIATPLLMVLWVNLYGGFIIGFFLLGFFALEALLQRNKKRFSVLTITALLCLAACLLNPTGVTLFYDLLNVSSDASKNIIQEWQGVRFSAAHSAFIIYLFLFLVVVMIRPLPLTRRERAIAYIWLLLGLWSLRHLRIFAIISTPLLAVGLHKWLSHKEARPLPAMLNRLLGSRPVASGVIALSCAASVWLFTASAAEIYQTAHFNPLPDLSQEIKWVEQNHPHARLLNSYNLGGPLIFLTRGQIPVFIDGRVGTAYPGQVISDYSAFHDASPGWEDIFERYHLDGVIIPNADNTFIGRFTGQKSWHLAFKGKTASLFLRDTR